MFEAEVKIMKLYKFDLGKFRVNEHYSLLFCLLASLKESDEVVQKSFIYLNESFLCESFSIENYPDIVASCVTIASNEHRKAEENNNFNETWYLSHYFNPEKVNLYTEILKKFLGFKGVIFLAS